MSSGQTSLEQMLGVYKWVVDDVIKNVREDFLNEGADTQVLEDLKQLWENKLVQSGALSRPVKNTEPHPHKDSPDKHSGKSATGAPATTVSASVIQQAPPRPSPSSTTPPTTSTTSPALVLPPPPLISASSSSSRPVTVTTTSNNTSPVPSQTPPSTAPPTNATPTIGGAAGSPSQQPPLIGMPALAQQATIYQSLTSAMTTGASPVVAGNPLQSLVIPGASISGLSPGLSLIQHAGIPYAAVPTPTGVTYVPIALNLPTATLPTTHETTSNIPQSDGPLPPVVLMPSKKSTTDVNDIDTSTIEHLVSSIEPLNSSEPLNSNDSSSTDLNDITIGHLTCSTEPLNSNDSSPESLASSFPEPLSSFSESPNIDNSTECLKTPVKSFIPLLPSRALTPEITFSLKKKPTSRRKHITQLDGPPGSSSEESDDSSESEVEDDFEEEPLNDEEPLNSDDDAESDEEDDNVWETDNTIVCQFEKVYRVRSKWKFALKDGIMHLKGHDYIFTKTSGEAEW